MTIMPSDRAKANRLMLALGGIVIHLGQFEFAQSAVLTIHHGVDERESGQGGNGGKRLPRDTLSQQIDSWKRV